MVQNSCLAYKESGQDNICSFYKEKITFLSGYLLPTPQEKPSRKKKHAYLI